MFKDGTNIVGKEINLNFVHNSISLYFDCGNCEKDPCLLLNVAKNKPQ